MCAFFGVLFFAFAWNVCAFEPKHLHVPSHAKQKCNSATKHLAQRWANGPRDRSDRYGPDEIVHFRGKRCVKKLQALFAPGTSWSKETYNDGDLMSNAFDADAVRGTSYTITGTAFLPNTIDLDNFTSYRWSKDGELLSPAASSAVASQVSFGFIHADDYALVDAPVGNVSETGGSTLSFFADSDGEPLFLGYDYVCIPRLEEGFVIYPFYGTVDKERGFPRYVFGNEVAENGYNAFDGSAVFELTFQRRICI